MYGGSNFCWASAFTLSLKARFKAVLAGLNLGYQENVPLKPRKPSLAGFINIFLCEFELG